MYGVVVLMALSTSAESPDFGKRGCHGCSGSCSGVVYSGCSSSCHGGHHREKHHKSHGCQGSCHGTVIYGCTGGCHSEVIHGCTGGHVAPVIHGCTGGHPAIHGCTGGAPAGGAMMMPHAQFSQPGSPATVTVVLPSAAQLVIDDYTVPTASDRHIYVANTLQAGESRTITFKATINQQPIVRQVTITGGQETTVNLATGDAVASR